MHCQGVQLFGIIQVEGGEAVKRIKDWEELTIQDNFLFQKVMRNKRLCQHLIEKILQIKIADILPIPIRKRRLISGWTARAYAWMCMFKTIQDGYLTLKCSVLMSRTADWRNGRAIIRL